MLTPVDIINNDFYAKIDGFERYYISKDGVIINSERWKIVKPVKIKGGYLLVGLYKNGKRRFFMRHRLVASAFIPNPNGKPFINHKNGITNDNRVENLEWCTHQENMIHAFVAGLNERGRENARKMGLKNKGRSCDKVKTKVIDTATGAIFSSVKDAADKFGINPGTLSGKLRQHRTNNTSLRYLNNTFNTKEDEKV